MKLSFLLCLTAVVLVSAKAEPWYARPGRGIYRREAEPEAEAFHRRPGGAIYKREAEAEPREITFDEPLRAHLEAVKANQKREPGVNFDEPLRAHLEAVKQKREPEAFHRRPGGAIYKREAEAEAEAEPAPEAEAEPKAKRWYARPGRGIY